MSFKKVMGIITRLRTGCFSELMKSWPFRDTGFSQDSNSPNICWSSKYNIVYYCRLNYTTICKVVAMSSTSNKDSIKCFVHIKTAVILIHIHHIWKYDRQRQTSKFVYIMSTFNTNTLNILCWEYIHYFCMVLKTAHLSYL